MNEIISLRHLNRRLRLRQQGQALGFCRASKRIDTCRTCHTWDTVHARELARSVTELKEMLLDIFPDYFAEFNAPTLFMWSTAVDMGSSLPYIWSRWKNLSLQKKTEGLARTPRRGKTCSARDDRGHGVGKLLGDDGIINVVKLYAQHWQLRDFVKCWLSYVQVTPTPERVFFWLDFADSFFPIGALPSSGWCF